MSNLKLLLSYNLLPIGGLFLLFISIMGAWGDVIDYNIHKNGFSIIAKVIEAPIDCDNISRRGGFCKLEYNEKIYTKKAGRKFCHLVSGQETVKMITNKDADSLLFPDEFSDFEFVSPFILLVFALFVMIKYYVPLSKINGD